MYFLLAFLFIFRTLFGLANTFWADDEIQIFLLGLKYFSTGLWPYYGPDVVYTSTQIPGALQAFLIAIPLKIFNFPEAPIIFLNILSFLSLAFLGFYLSKRVPEIPSWMVMIYLMTLPWTLGVSTKIYNPSYLLAPSIVFFVSWIETWPQYRVKIIPPGLSVFLMGFCMLYIAQLHLSWVLLVPYVLVTFYNHRYSHYVSRFFLVFVLGACLSGSLLIPTLLKDGISGSNIVFNMQNIFNFFTILVRLLSFPSYETFYFLGANIAERLSFFKEYYLFAPAAALVTIVGFGYTLMLIFLLFKNKSKSFDWRFIRNTTFFTFFLTFLSFFFSIKGPSSHTFYIVLPVVLLFSVYGLRELKVHVSRPCRVFTIGVLVVNFVFDVGWGIRNFQKNSLYQNRAKVVTSIQNKNYRLIGSRRGEGRQRGY